MHREFSFYSPGPLLALELQNWKDRGTTGRKRSSLDSDLFGRRMRANVRRCPAFILWQTGNYPSFRGEKGEKCCLKVDRAYALPRLSIHFAKLLCQNARSRITTKCY